ncbi:MAG: Gfo/Idh/MocA family oxidoreductase, partial [Thermoguttaceae bacterium]|nr:Gfo/Idh/MocA family oxidoreductase [Thermoguttaceae bacterium]
MKIKKFGIVGCGMIATFHARAIREIGAELVACYDTLPLAAERLAKEFGCKPYSDFKAFLADPDVEIVTIGTPSGAHLDPAVAAATAGKHVIVEKPLEVTPERCDEIIDACDKAGVVLSTVFPSRFHPSSILMKEAVEAGRFGKQTLGDAI